MVSDITPGRVLTTQPPTDAQVPRPPQGNPDLGTPPGMAAHPWFAGRCQELRAQLRQAKRLNPRSAEVKLLGRQYQTQMRHARTRHNQQEIQDQVL